MVSSLDSCARSDDKGGAWCERGSYVFLHFVSELDGVEHGSFAGHRLHTAFLAREAFLDHLHCLQRLPAHHLGVLVRVVVGDGRHGQFVQLADD